MGSAEIQETESLSLKSDSSSDGRLTGNPMLAPSWGRITSAFSKIAPAEARKISVSETTLSGRSDPEKTWSGEANDTTFSTQNASRSR